ncbi:MAG: SpoIID/LytB domain-containing protein [Ignavibacteriaceae bacterium]
MSCSSSKRFTTESDGIEEKNKIDNILNNESDITSEFRISESGTIRVLLNEYTSSKTVRLESTVDFISGNSKLAIVNRGNEIQIKPSSNSLNVSIRDRRYVLNEFILSPAGEENIIVIDGKKYKGKIKISNAGGNLIFINQISLEDYVKGVMLKEMPLGKGNENYEALKAFSICVRTYAFTKIFERKLQYDILPDTRDQVYGGVEGESELSNKIVDETRSQILTFKNQPAVIFYHSTCGGITEDASNVFSNVNVTYLKSIIDGSPANCTISPRYSWTEIIPEYQIINRLQKSGYLNSNNYSVKTVSINSRFKSGRVNELEIRLSSSHREEKSVKLFGNNIRSVIRTADDKSILRSNFFEISGQSGGNIILKGRGAGHGVGLCQWGAISLSRTGLDYKRILAHYYPGTEIQTIDDK